MENKIGRVVGVILGGRPPRHGLPPRSIFRPQSLRLVARPDRETHRIVENALAVSSLRGHTAAIDYLVAAKVPLRIISRVLWQPERRRSPPPV